MEFDILAKVIERPTLAEVVGGVPRAEESAEKPIEAEVELSESEDRVEELASKVEAVSSRVEEAWTAIEELKRLAEDVASLARSIDSRARAASRVVEVVTLWKCSRCRFFRDGLCTAWRLSEDFARVVEEAFGPEAIARDGDVIRVRIDKAFVIGAICPLFKAKS